MSDLSLNEPDTTHTSTHRADLLNSMEKGTAALTDLVGAAMVRSIARRVGRTVAPQAQGMPIRGVPAITS